MSDLVGLVSESGHVAKVVNCGLATMGLLFEKRSDFILAEGSDCVNVVRMLWVGSELS